MLKTRLKAGIALIAVFTLFTCIDPYTPKLKGNEALLVVDGLITDANASYTVKLSRTFQDLNSTPLLVSDAIVLITDDAGNSSYLINNGGGIYTTDSLEFTGTVGRTYTLNITTDDGNEYVSDACAMQSVPDIDSIYFNRVQELVNNNSESQVGIMIYLDSKAGDNNQYYRWDFEETWEFQIPYPKEYDYINSNTIVPVANVNEVCWKYSKSDDILIYSNYSGQAGPVKKEPISFIASDQSDRFMNEYSILINQYSISKNEYDFWDNLKQVNETGGDIFASQPFSVISNIHNINNPNEKVLGYFRVSAVKRKRIFISFDEIVKLHMPFYNNNQCELIEAIPEPPMTFDDLYTMFCVTSDYYFVEPEYNSVTDVLEKLAFARPECADCELTGTMTKPDFWIDMK